MKKLLERMRRKTIKSQRIVEGESVEVLYHYYPGKRSKLYAVINGSVKMSYAGAIAQKIYKRLKNEQVQTVEQYQTC